MATKVAEKTAPAKGSSATWFVFGFIALLAVGGGVAVPFFLPGGLFEKTSEGHEGEKGKDKVPALISFGETVVNLAEERMTRYLRVKLILVVDESQEKAVTDLLAKKKPFLKTWLISHLSDQSMQEVGGKAGANRIRREILNQFNAMLFPDGSEKIRDVLFEEFNVQ